MSVRHPLVDITKSILLIAPINEPSILLQKVHDKERERDTNKKHTKQHNRV